MSSSWWANQIGSAATATTPTGSIPQYGLALDLGTAPWTGTQHKIWTQDEIRRTRGKEIQAAEAQVEESYFNQALGAVGGFLGNVFGSIQRSGQELVGDVPDDPEMDRIEENQALAGQGIDNIMATPGAETVVAGFENFYNALETPFILDRHATMNAPTKGFWASYDGRLWLDKSAWAAAWREAEERTIGEALVDNLISGQHTTEADLERLRRTNSLYGLTSLAGDLVVGFKADPTVLAAKGLGEIRAVRAGDLPRGQTSRRARAEAQNVLQSETVEDALAYRYRGFNPAGFYGAHRGKRLIQNFDDVWKAAEELDWADFSDLPMFRGKAVNGPQAAVAFKEAAKDPKLRDLTRRAVIGDVNAWREINRLQNEAVPEEIAKYADADTKVFLDAIDQTKTKQKQLESEIGDLEKVIARREEQVPFQDKDGHLSSGFFNYHTWELHRDLEAKMRDLDEITMALESHTGYADWLRAITDNGGPSLENLSTRQNRAQRRMREVSQRTYHESPHSKAHTVAGIARATYVREANPIDLHHADSGVRSIRRQFEQYRHLFNYTDRDALNDVLERYSRAPDEGTRRQIAQEVELVHGVRALAHGTGLSEETIDAFLRTSRLRVDDMYDRLLSGGDSIYSTLPDRRTVEIIEGDRKHTFHLPIDVTQLPNYYTPMDIRRTHLAIKRNRDLFEEIDTAYRNGLRATAGRTMNTIDQVGTQFNSVWKPFQLFRLAWPQRVLLDESFRAMATLGAFAWAKQQGGALLHGTVNGFNPLLHGPIAAYQRRRIKVGPGPLVDEITGRAPRKIAEHDAEVQEAPFVPSRFTPRPDKKRAESLAQIIGANNELRKYRIRRAALIREARKSDAGPGRVVIVANEEVPDRGYGQPINQRLSGYVINEDRDWQTFDPITGKGARQGYAVPVKSKTLRYHPGELDHGGIRGAYEVNHDLNDFIEANADLLASGGYRISFERKGDFVTAHVVRVFRRNEVDTAAEFAAHANADHFVDLSTGTPEYVRAWGDQSPIMEALERAFIQEERVKFEAGRSPAKGAPPVFHGAGRPLPDELAPREDVPIARGNMVGQGFYTTAARHIAEQYARQDPTRLYTIRGAKSKKRFQVFDVDQEMSLLENAELRQWMREQYEELARTTPEVDMDDVEEALELIRDIETWLMAFQQLDQWLVPGPLQPQQLLTRYLIEKKNAGALTHQGGRVVGDEPHQVYIWLFPEELEVRPAYIKTGKYHLLEEWFANPESIENLVPENRIHRVGPKPREQARQRAAADAAAGERMEATVSSELDPDLDFSAWERDLDSTHSRFLRRLERRRQFGSGKATFKDRNGKRVVTRDIFADEGENYLPLVSASPAFSRLGDTYQRTLAMYRKKAVGHRRIHPPAMDEAALRSPKGRRQIREYLGAWADLVNDQVRNSPIWFRMLDGQTNDEIVQWLTSTHEGKLLRDRLPHKGHDPVRWVEEHREHLDYYLPSDELQALLRQRRINPSDLRRLDAQDMPTVFGPDLEMVAGDQGWGQVIGKLTEKIYHALGTVPTDTLVRQPFARGMYELKMRNLLASADGDTLTNADLRRMEKISREFALRQVRRTLFDLSDESNFTQAVRFLAPFWGAQEEALIKWFRIMYERPETVARFYVGQNVMYQNFAVIDEDGKPVDSPDGLLNYNPNHRVVLQIPKNLEKVPFFSKALKTFGHVGISIGAMNTALQGDQPLLPGLGPWVNMPADWFLDNFRKDMGASFDENGLYRWIFPVGRPDEGFGRVLDNFLPGWARRLQQLTEGEQNRTYASTYTTVARELALDHKKRGLPPPSPKEIEEAVQEHYYLRIIASFGLPFPMEWRPKNQFFIDEYHKFQQLYGPEESFPRFVRKYGPDMARYAASGSNSTVGVAPTQAGMKDWMAKDDLFQKYGEEWGTAMLSPDAWADDFSSDAYDSQFEIRVAPGRTDTLRELVDPESRLEEVDVRLGWLEFRKLDSAINAELFARGLTSIQQAGAEDLAYLKSEAVRQLMLENEAWGRDYRTYEDTIYFKVNQLQGWVFDKRFDSRPDIQGVRQYLMLREQVATELDRWGTQGGSRNLDAEENGALREWFYMQVGALVQANPAFGEFYSRYLSQDRLTRGSGP